MRGNREEEIGIIYEDDHLLVVNKPSGLLTMSAGRQGEETVYRIVTDYVRNGRSQRGRGPHRRGGDRIFIVHRLDRDTSGILLFAKNEEIKFTLQDNWNEIVLERKYIALVEGVPRQAEGTVTSWLHDNPATMTVHSSPYDNGGKKATTHYKVIREIKSGTVSDKGQTRHHFAPGYALVEFELETGRKNQIRVHSAEMGHPVAGDRKYGARTSPIGRLALHAMTISFRHPATGKVMRFSTGIPNAFKRIR
ncbi:MAG: RluA family pseudouridine synthase [Bacteroidales bacterium]|nr:RluA family pseudouridine synthase [Bacteroidales bacterium]